MRETEQASTPLEADVTPSLDEVFRLLSSRRRRYTLYHLYEQDDGVATATELTNHVARLEVAADETPPTEVTDELITTIRTELQHVHLPKLEDAGVLEQDQRSETVRYWTQPSLEEWLEHAYHKESTTPL
ncbi:DUF7344 domain-containing protein [Natronolimnobius baerhuensis]|uniref:DUF7344 domain-containing protein n=1 Tax=Natronolimnobius baerhuensis TaxID=253108 RepID=A0A202E795_9EURY|nr:hypothetical protein [Natronolimnobius baerhuensis]OVE84125.1 hypothetical protein B2G88_06775 [Natronolimnobius baerhuensis]